MLPLCMLFKEKGNHALVYRLGKDYNRRKIDVRYDQARKLMTLPKMKADNKL